MHAKIHALKIERFSRNTNADYESKSSELNRRLRIKIIETELTI